MSIPAMPPVGGNASFASISTEPVQHASVPGGVKNLPGAIPSSSDGFTKSFHYNEGGADTLGKPGIFRRLREAVGGGVKNVKQFGGSLWNKTVGRAGNTAYEHAQNHFVQTGKRSPLMPFIKPSEGAKQLRWFNTQGMQRLSLAADAGAGVAGGTLGAVGVDKWLAHQGVDDRLLGKTLGFFGGGAAGVGINRGVVKPLVGEQVGSFFTNLARRVLLRR